MSVILNIFKYSLFAITFIASNSYGHDEVTYQFDNAERDNAQKIALVNPASNVIYAPAPAPVVEPAVPVTLTQVDIKAEEKPNRGFIQRLIARFFPDKV